MRRWPAVARTSTQHALVTGRRALLRVSLWLCDGAAPRPYTRSIDLALSTSTESRGTQGRQNAGATLGVHATIPRSLLTFDLQQPVVLPSPLNLREGRPKGPSELLIPPLPLSSAHCRRHGRLRGTQPATAALQRRVCRPRAMAQRDSTRHDSLARRFCGRKEQQEEDDQCEGCQDSRSRCRSRSRQR